MHKKTAGMRHPAGHNVQALLLQEEGECVFPEPVIQKRHEEIKNMKAHKKKFPVLQLYAEYFLLRCFLFSVMNRQLLRQKS